MAAPTKPKRGIKKKLRHMLAKNDIKLTYIYTEVFLAMTGPGRKIYI